MRTSKSVMLLCVLLASTLVSGCGQIIADSIYGDRYLKPISTSRPITAKSQKEAVNAAIAAAGKTDWIPKTISIETGYVLAEQVPNVKYTAGARDYTFRLEVRLPENGSGDASIVITPPQGLVSEVTMEQIATKYLDALDAELAAKRK